ncbi:hypothetical protein Hanom_Chr05g00439661 [Helianthus anomalus]
MSKACQKSYHDLKTTNDEVVKLKGECDIHQYEGKWLGSIEEVEKLNQQAVVTDDAVDALTAICEWLIDCGVPLLADAILTSDALTPYMVELAQSAYDNGRRDRFAEGKTFV